jgi:DNA-binding NarL/FixJ family response regulator/tetratricopeptide (TPR) repeat protein
MLSGVMGVPLVGREAALRAIDLALDGLGNRRGGALCFAGEPGIGKSRLLAELASRADERELLVLEGRAAEFEDDLPFGAFVDALDDYLAALGRRALARLDPAALAHLETVFPALAGPGDRVAPPVLEERFRSHRAVRWLLGWLAVERPMVLVLDDVHWVDPASAELLGYLLSHSPPGPVLLALGYRPTQLSERVRAALERGEADGRLQPVRLTPLSRADAALVVGSALPDRRLDDLIAESGGNPFYLLELARAADRGETLDGPARPAAEIPGKVIAAIDREIAALPDSARSLARGAAVVGDPYDLELAATTADTVTAHALPALDGLLASGLMRTTDVPRRFAFRHPIVRRAVYESAPAGWRIAAHRRLAAALRERGASAVELAHHLEAAASQGEQDAIDVLTAAGHVLARQAPAIAARRFEAALRLLPPGEAAAEQRLELLAALARSLDATGRRSASRHALLEALSLLSPDAVGQRVRLEASCAGVEQWLGLHGEARRRLQTALDSLPDRRSPEAATLMIELAASQHWDADYTSVRTWAAQAAEISAAAGDRPAEAAALALVALGDYGVGAAARGQETVRAAAALVDGLTDTELAARPDAAYHLAYHETLLERYDEATRHADRSLRVAHTTGQGQLSLPTLVTKATALRYLGRLDDAAEVAQEAVEGARLAGHDQLTAFAVKTRAWVATAQGELEIALAGGEECLAIARRLARPMSVAGTGWILGEALLEAGQPARCATVLLETTGGPDAERQPAAHRCYSWSMLARAEAQRGHHSEAQAWIDRLDAALPALAPLAFPRTLAEHARAHLLLARGDPAAAAGAALAAAEAADGISARVEAARGRLLAGRALGAAGERERAVRLLEQAQAELDECGARRYGEEAVQELRRLGRRVSRTGRPVGAAPGALSNREREVAVLAAAGHTNKDIAAELFLSVKTVERHMSHIFHKLRVTSRAQIGVALRDED